MIALVVLGVVLLWALISLVIARLAAKRIKKGATRYVAGGVIFAAVLVAPVADELLSAPSFRRLCEQYSEIVVDVPNSHGRTVWPNVERKQVRAALVDVIQRDVSQIDAATGEKVLHYSLLSAMGGWFSRKVLTSFGGEAIVFRNHCVPNGYQALTARFGIKVERRP